MKTWTTAVDCICGDKHTFYTFGEVTPSGHYVYKCGSLKVKMDSEKQTWIENAQVPKDAKKIIPN